MYLRALRRVFIYPRYVLVFAMVAFTVLSAAILLPQFAILKLVFTNPAFSLLDSLAFLFSLYASLGANVSLLSGIALVSLTLLFALDVTLMTYYIRRRQTAPNERTAQAAGIGGIVSGIMGIGCAACGSVILTALFGIFGGVGLLTLLPLHGVEFGFLGIVLLLFTTRYLLKRINDPLVCPVWPQEPRP